MCVYFIYQAVYMYVCVFYKATVPCRMLESNNLALSVVCRAECLCLTTLLLVLCALQNARV